MTKSVGLELGWTPSELESLYLDAQDLRGLEYWYDAIAAMNNKLKPKEPTGEL